MKRVSLFSSCFGSRRLFVTNAPRPPQIAIVLGRQGTPCLVAVDGRHSRRALSFPATLPISASKIWPTRQAIDLPRWEYLKLTGHAFRLLTSPSLVFFQIRRFP